MDVKRTRIILKPSNTRVVIRPFEVTNEARIEKILARVSSLPEGEVERLLEKVMREFRERHQRTREFFLHRFDQVRAHLLTDQPVSENRRLLIGSYFTQEPAWMNAARSAFEWFLGRNDLGQDLYDPGTGGCCDGLQEDRINRNQGAESTLAFLLSLAEMNLLESSLAVFRQAR